MTDIKLDSTTSVDEIDCTYLTALIRKAGYNDITIASFQKELVGGKSHGGGCLYRFRLNYAENSSMDAPDSLILKESREIKSQALDPAFARREVDCYQNNLFQGINKKLYIPEAYHAAAQPDQGQYWIWMKDLGEEAFKIDWSPKIFTEMIGDIAELHAAWWGREEEFKQMPFLRRRAQAMYDGLWVDRIQKNCQEIEGHPKEAQIRKVFTLERCSILMKLSRAEEVIYPKLEALPQTLLHHDIWPPNLGRYQGKTVLIDWSYVGPGTPGADLSQTAALLFQMWDPNFDDEALLQALWTGLKEDFGLPITYEEIAAGYELTFCLRPAHALGGPILGSILAGKEAMVGGVDLERKLTSAEATFRRIERGLSRLEK